MTPHGMTLATVLLAASMAAGVPSVEKPAVPSAVPAGLEEWSFLIGDWEMMSRRYSLDGPVIEENTGRAKFSITLEGFRIQERQRTTMAGRSMVVLNLFAHNPERGEWETSWTDSLHHSFNVMRGTGTKNSIVLYEKNPRKTSDVTRRVTYKRESDDEFSRLLEFSLDKGKTWVRRNETSYTRRK